MISPWRNVGATSLLRRTSWWMAVTRLLLRLLKTDNGAHAVIIDCEGATVESAVLPK